MQVEKQAGGDPEGPRKGCECHAKTHWLERYQRGTFCAAAARSAGLEARQMKDEVGSGDREELRLASRFGTKQQGLGAPAVCQEGEGWETGDTE